MELTTYNKIKTLGFTGTQETDAKTVIDWLGNNELLRIEPYWRFLGANGGFSWTKTWEEYSEPVEVECETWQELLEIALEKSVMQAFS